ncbi:MAG: GlxA family transcriptional regulator [Oleiphilus sp.]
MRHVTIIGFDYAFASAITGMSDLLSSVGVTWNYIHGETSNKQFDVCIATVDGKDVKCANGLTISAHHSIAEINQTDLLIIPTIAGDIHQTLSLNKKVLPWLVKMHEQGADIVSNCTGAFLLAESGLLNYKKATTHWGFVDEFKRRYPLVDLQAEQMITTDGAIFCSGGGMAWFDMALYLIERYCGYDIAKASSKSYVIDMGRGSQAAYSSIPGKRYHQDERILDLQDWLDGHFNQALTIEDLASQAKLTERTLKRRFKEATGESPIQYIQHLRIEAAKKRLENSKSSVEEITHQVGYENFASFIRLFKRFTKMTPSAYRARFARNNH